MQQVCSYGCENDCPKCEYEKLVSEYSVATTTLHTKHAEWRSSLDVKQSGHTAMPIELHELIVKRTKLAFRIANLEAFRKEDV